MSVFTNPASGTGEDGGRYVAAVLGLLGDQDPLVVLGATVRWCRDNVAGLTPAQLETPEGPGKWSIGEVLQHLADSELVWGHRLRRVLAEDRPPLIGYDQDLWARRLGYRQAESGQAIRLFSALRQANLHLLERAEDQDLDRVGIHAERGPESLRHMIRLYAGHDLLHRKQITRIRESIGGSE